DYHSDDQRDDDRNDREGHSKEEEDAKDAEDGGEGNDNDAEALSQIDHNVPPLSAQEMVILRGLVRGDSNKAIARRMLIAEATVKVHVKAILSKIKVRNRTQAAIWAMNNRRLIPLKENGLASGIYACQ